MKCIKCEHPAHIPSVCDKIEGQINGIDRPCTCDMSIEENKTGRIKQSTREEKKKIKEKLSETT